MTFDIKDYKGYVPCEFNSKFIIFKDSRHCTWKLCLANELDCLKRPLQVGIITYGLKDHSKNSFPLAWEIRKDFRGQGIMSNFLNDFLREVAPSATDGFSAIIMKKNTPSVKLALKNGFQIYKEDEDKYFLSFSQS